MNAIRITFQLAFVVGILGIAIIYSAQDIVAAYWPGSWLDRDFE